MTLPLQTRVCVSEDAASEVCPASASVCETRNTEHVRAVSSCLLSCSSHLILLLSLALHLQAGHWEPLSFREFQVISGSRTDVARQAPSFRQDSDHIPEQWRCAARRHPRGHWLGEVGQPGDLADSAQRKVDSWVGTLLVTSPPCQCAQVASQKR